MIILAPPHFFTTAFVASIVVWHEKDRLHLNEPVDRVVLYFHVRNLFLLHTCTCDDLYLKVETNSVKRVKIINSFIGCTLCTPLIPIPAGYFQPASRIPECHRVRLVKERVSKGSSQSGASEIHSLAWSWIKIWVLGQKSHLRAGVIPEGQCKHHSTVLAFIHEFGPKLFFKKCVCVCVCVLSLCRCVLCLVYNNIQCCRVHNDYCSWNL